MDTRHGRLELSMLLVSLNQESLDLIICISSRHSTSTAGIAHNTFSNNKITKTTKANIEQTSQISKERKVTTERLRITSAKTRSNERNIM